MMKIELQKLLKQEKDQLDNDLPWELEPNMSICILRHGWHRVWKGKGKLVLKINKS